MSSINRRPSIDTHTTQFVSNASSTSTPPPSTEEYLEDSCCIICNQSDGEPIIKCDTCTALYHESCLGSWYRTARIDPWEGKCCVCKSEPFEGFLMDDSIEYSLNAVKQNPWFLHNVRHQTIEICVEAIRRNWEVLCLVKDRTPELIQQIRGFIPDKYLDTLGWGWIRTNPYARYLFSCCRLLMIKSLSYRDQVPEIILEAMRWDPQTDRFVKDNWFICDLWFTCDFF